MSSFFGKHKRAIERKVIALCRPLLPHLFYDFSLFGPYGAGNIGDDGILEALIARHFDPGKQRLAILTENPEATSRHVNLSHLIARTDNVELRNMVRKSKGMLIAGGTMISDLQGMGFPFGYSKATLKAIRDFNKPHAMMGIGINSVTSLEGIRFFQTWYDQVEVFTVRDDHCGNVLLDLGISQDRIVIAADPVFGWTPQSVMHKLMHDIIGKINNYPVKIAVNVTHEEWRTKKSLYTELASCCDLLTQRLGAAVVFFASDCRLEDSFDSAAIQVTRAQMLEPALVLPPENFKPAELATFLSHFDIVLSMRMHPLIFGALGGAVPVGIIRQPKMVRVLSEMGFEPDIHAETATTAQLFEVCHTALENLTSFRCSMRVKLDLLAERELLNRKAIEAVAS